jgi:hypothetical protein
MATQPGASVQRDPVVAGDLGLESHRVAVQRLAEAVTPADLVGSVVVIAGQPDPHPAVRPDPDRRSVEIAAGGVAQVHRQLGATAATRLVRQFERDAQSLIRDSDRPEPRRRGSAACQRADRAAAVPNRELGPPGRGGDGPRATALRLAEAV